MKSLGTTQTALFIVVLLFFFPLSVGRGGRKSWRTDLGGLGSEGDQGALYEIP